jgi:hypothetical protein
METLKKVLISTAVLVGIVFVALIYGLREKLPGFSQARASGPPFEWLAVTNGETSKQLYQILGTPTEQSTSNADVWRKGGGTLRVTYNENGCVTNVWREGVWGLIVPFDEKERGKNVTNQTSVK